MKRLSFTIGIATAVGALGFLLWLVTDYGRVWVHPEYFYQIDRHAFPNKHLGIRDLLDFFDCDAIGEKCTRARFLTYLATGLIIKTRLLIWKFVPPHPSFSPIWLLSLGSLFCLFRTVLLLTKQRDVAYAIVGLYTVSVGFLSHFAHLLHAAKPLVSVLMISSIYCAVRLVDLGPKAPVYSRRRWWIGLLASLIGAFLSDEIGWVMWPAIPVIAPSLFIRDGRPVWRAICAYAALVPAVIIFLTIAAPIGSGLIFGKHFNFWGWMFHWGWPLPEQGSAPDELSFFQRLTISAILSGGYNMWRNITVIPDIGSWAPMIGWCVTLILIGLFLFSPNKWLVARLFAVLCGYIVFQGLITLRQTNVVGHTTYHTYYYGSSFPIFALLLLAPLLASKVGRIAGLALVPYVFVAQMANFLLLNKDAAFSLERQSYPQAITERYKGIGYNIPLTFQKTLELWRAARRGEAVEAYANQFSVSDLWLLREMERVQSP